MRKITDWRNIGQVLALFVAATILPAVLTCQAQAGDWSDSSQEDKRVFIGIYPEDLDDDDNEALDYKGKGILVEDVVEDGPAEKAGIKAGDIIAKIDAEEITSTSQFREVLSKYKSGDKIKVSTVRNGAIIDQIVELSGLPKNKEYSFKFGHDSNDTKGFLGVVTESIEGDFAKYFGVKKGALIKKVIENSPAEKVGLKPGDVLTEIGDEEIEETDDVSEAVRDHKPGDQVKVKYFREGKEASVDVKLAKIPSSTMKMNKNDQHRIIISNEDEVIVDTDALRKVIHEALEEARISLDDGKDELRKELEQLKVELDQLKKDMEAKKKEEKDKK